MFGRKRATPTQSQDALERKYDQHLRASMLASGQGRLAEATQHSEAALAVSRRLYEASGNPARHRPALAAALYNHAGYLRRAGRAAEAMTLLTESGAHYQALASQNPAAYQIKWIDVQVRTALARRATSDREGAVAQLREAVNRYGSVVTDDLVERDLGAARAYFHLGRCLLELGRLDEGLEQIDEGLFAAERVRQGAGLSGRDFSWLAAAPQSFRMIAPDWVAAALCAMQLHDAAGRFEIAADAGNIAVRVSAGLAAMGAPAHRQLYQTVLTKAQQVWDHAQHPARAAAQQAGPGQEVDLGRGGSSVAPDLSALMRTAGWSDDV